MNSALKPAVIIVSLQVQTSFQAVPLGAACIVSALKNESEISRTNSILLSDYSIEDADLAGLSAADAGVVIAGKIALLCKESPIAGFSIYVWNRSILESAALHLRALVPGIILFAGGPEVTADPASFAAEGAAQETGSVNIFDYLICGEGERASVALIRALRNGTALPQEILLNQRFPGEDCAVLASPWIDGTLEESTSVRDCKGALWELARGCPYNCAYCYESKGEKKVRTIPLDRLEKELAFFVKSGIERVFVLDPTYNASRDRALLILRMIEKTAGELHFNFEVRAEHLDREMVEAFAKIPCSLQIGLQSTNPEALKAVNRPVDLSLFSKKIALLNDVGIVFGLDLMYGLPGDSLSTFRSSLDTAIGFYPNNLEVFRLSVLPGTILADNAATLGLKAQKTPPYHIESTPKFPSQDLERAGAIARACDVFYTQGRAVTWFLSALYPVKLKPAQFFQDFAQYLADKKISAGETELTQAEAQVLQLEFTEMKYREKGKAFLWPILCDIIQLNGAWTRALAEGEETRLSLSYHPDDLFSPDAIDLEYFVDNAYMENCTVRIFSGADGPEMEIL